MPLFDEPHKSTVVSEQIQNKEDTSIVPYFESERSKTILLSALPGLKWSVTYFNREVNDNTLLTEFDATLDITLHSFNRVNNFIIHVEQALPSSITNDITGNGIIDCGFKPTFNDIFLTKTPDGRVLLFEITSVSRVSYNSNNIFNIDYKVRSILDSINDEVLTSLTNSTNNVFYYNKNFRLDNTPDMYSSNDVDTRKIFTDRISKLEDTWCKIAINDKTNYVIGYRNTNGVLVYDCALKSFVYDTIGVTKLTHMLEEINIPKTSFSILDFIKNPDIGIETIYRYKTFLSSSSYGKRPILNPMTRNGIGYSVNLTNILPVDIEAQDILNSVYPKIDNKNYIFRDVVYSILEDSEYVPEVTLTTFENVILDMCNGNILSVTDINTLYTELFKLPDIEMFYYMPILSYIIKYYLLTFTVEFI